MFLVLPQKKATANKTQIANIQFTKQILRVYLDSDVRITYFNNTLLLQRDKLECSYQNTFTYTVCSMSEALWFLTDKSVPLFTSLDKNNFLLSLEIFH